MQKDSIIPSEQSWWLDEALKAEGSISSAAPLIGKVEFDVAIVGGGFTGLWTAIALKERAPDLKIGLIEASICGAGASGKNGGKVHGYWASLPGMVQTIGRDAALAVARAGTKAQDGIRTFVTAPGRDVWWREAGNVRVATTKTQEAKILPHVKVAQELGVGDTAQALTQEMLADYCSSPAFLSGMYLPEGANVQPARLARALRKAVIELGVSVYENTPMLGLDKGTINRLRTPQGEILARDIVLATNTALAKEPDMKPHLTVFSSYALMTEQAPDKLEEMGWTGDQGIADLRMFVHYFRKTADGRMLMGSGSGPISFNGNFTAPELTNDLSSAQRAASGLRRLLPMLNDTGIAKVWGGGIEISADRLPFFRTRPGTRIHYGCGYSGHGVNPTYIGGQCLASLVLDIKDEWTSLPFCTRSVPKLPPEPFRTIGGRLVRKAIITCEEADENGVQAPWAMRAAAAIPRVLGLKIGTR
ncbi:NAD(P)/FAD-dependent oxidoreductase [Paenochrobactrum pullorum]|uniref:NAD(P)/FAD-dependent oxidoreductase n=1 Tax=Paenochrobactrum pullorum TaxID=1324351 RepID=UPI0035BC11BB